MITDLRVHQNIIYLFVVYLFILSVMFGSTLPRFLALPDHHCLNAKLLLTTIIPKSSCPRTLGRLNPACLVM